MTGVPATVAQGWAPTTTTLALAECTCGWTYTGPDESRARAAAGVHATWHAYLARRDRPRPTTW